MIPAAVEELLRFESPVPFVPRVATRDGELGGCPDYHIPTDVELEFTPMLRHVEHLPLLFDTIND